MPARFEPSTFELNLVGELGNSDPVWTELPSSLSQPPPRRGACAAASNAAGLVMYGGHDSDSRELSLLKGQVHRLAAAGPAPSPASWSLVQLADAQDDAEQPPALAYCGLALWGRAGGGGDDGGGASPGAQAGVAGVRLYLSGGMDGKSELQHDVFVFEFVGASGVQGVWQRVKGPVFQVHHLSLSPPPPPALRPSCQPTLQSACCLSAEAGVYHQPSGPAVVPARQMHVAAAIDGRVLLFGGSVTMPKAPAQCAQLNAHASAVWSDYECARPLPSVCRSPRTLFNTSSFTPPLALAQGDSADMVTTPSQLQARAAAAAAQAMACALVEIQGLAVLPAWTNITGRYALEPTIHQGLPVYRRITYLPPARSGGAAAGAGGAVNFTGGTSPQPPDVATDPEDLLLFYSEGNWVVAPGLRLVMDTAEKARARLVAFSSAAYPHQLPGWTGKKWASVILMAAWRGARVQALWFRA